MLSAPKKWWSGEATRPRARLELLRLEDRSTPSTSYLVTNLVSDQPGVALITDPKLVNPWGIAESSASPFWVSNNGTASATLYQGDSPTRPAFTKNPLEVSIPSADPAGATPTGQVFNGSSDFKVPSGPTTTAAARFIFASQTGEIAGWNGGTQAKVAVTVPGASFTGLAIGSVGTANYLYAADFGHHTIDVFNGQYQPTTLAGSFTDPTMPHSYAPFNVQNLGGKLYVTYAQIDHQSPSDESDHGSGFVDVFDTSGNLLRRVVSGNHLKAPWGVAVAPSTFGDFSNDLLVGNFASGTIAAFDPTTGRFLGKLKGAAGKPIVIDGLWALTFGNGASGGDKSALYFSAGPDGETHGLFGSIRATEVAGRHAAVYLSPTAATGAAVADPGGSGQQAQVVTAPQQAGAPDPAGVGTAPATGPAGSNPTGPAPSATATAGGAWDDPLGGPMVG